MILFLCLGCSCNSTQEKTKIVDIQSSELHQEIIKNLKQEELNLSIPQISSKDSLFEMIRALSILDFLTVDTITNKNVIELLYQSISFSNPNQFEAITFRKLECENISNTYQLIVVTETSINMITYLGTSYVLLLYPNNQIRVLEESYINYLTGVYSKAEFMNENQPYLLLNYGTVHTGELYSSTFIFSLSSLPQMCLDIDFTYKNTLAYCGHHEAFEWKTDISISKNKAILKQNIKDCKGNKRTKVQYLPLCNREKVTLTSD